MRRPSTSLRFGILVGLLLAPVAARASAPVPTLALHEAGPRE